ncbi:MAG: hypothetical protein FI730_04270 [SAR202 cluster bacterium]|nr:hypothetical protein [SAR202 cluster bacterium]|tara:strand:+ start:24 stop:296 length:273 start_codon:yes stop_codon:yes gene_type:complete
MDIKNLKVIDIVFIVLVAIIKILGLYILINGWLVKSQANYRQFNEAINFSQQSYFQDVQLMGINQMILGTLLIIISLIVFSIYIRHFRSK